MLGKNFEEHLYKIIRKAWRGQTVPEEREMDITSPILQKNDPIDSKNYLGNSHYNTAYKYLSNIIKKRLKTLMEQQRVSYQAGFDRRKSIVNHNFFRF
jgi:hypothetical protein